jgi:hypothetical protein
MSSEKGKRTFLARIFRKLANEAAENLQLNFKRLIENFIPQQSR